MASILLQPQLLMLAHSIALNVTRAKFVEVQLLLRLEQPAPPDTGAIPKMKTLEVSVSTHAQLVLSLQVGQVQLAQLWPTPALCAQQATTVKELTIQRQHARKATSALRVLSSQRSSLARLKLSV